MDDALRRVFLTEVSKQCRFAMMAAADLRAALEQVNFRALKLAIEVGDPNRLTDDQDRLRLFLAERQPHVDRVFFSAQMILVAAANLSKVFWPMPKRATAAKHPAFPTRGDQLRDLLGVADASVLGDRAFRNHLEHFDERIEAWAIESPNRNWADSNIAAVGSISAIDPGDFVRNFDPDAFAFTYRGERILFSPLLVEIEAIQQSARRLLEPAGPT